MRRVVLLAVVVALGLAVAGLTPGGAGAAASREKVIVVLKAGANQADVVRNVSDQGGAVSARYRHALNGFAAALPPTAISALARDRRVLMVSPDREMDLGLPLSGAAGNSAGGSSRSSTCPINTQSGFPTQCIPPSIDRIEADRSSARAGDGRGSSAVNVAILDTGTQAAHPDLNVVGGKSCVNDGLSATDDPNLHGTHVGGSVAARDNGFGVVGAAPGANLWSVRVLKKGGSATESMLICGIDWVTATRSDADRGNDIAVVNMSIGGKGSDDQNCGLTNKDPFHLAICRSVAAGVTYVVAAGNESADVAEKAPATYSEVLTVAAMTDYDGIPGGRDPTNCFGDPAFADDKYAFFSNFATSAEDRAHTVAAPGVCVVSTVPLGTFLPEFDTNYGIDTGTSMATPHVAGVVAQCIAGGACTGKTPAQIIQKIVADAAAYNISNPTYGFIGDPQHPIAGKYYGNLIRAALY